MRVGIIGAGPSGLISAKMLSNAEIEYDVFESNDKVGGTWIYSENFIDKHGLPLHTSSYKNLTTNLPKELMLFEGMEYNIQGKSFIPAADVLEYLENFANKFNIESKIKFEHFVSKVSRKSDCWELVAKDLKTDIETKYSFDSIFVCNGHFSIPFYPEICGSGSFPGSAIHSHFYKVPEIYCDKTVLIIGIGPSGTDIVFDISPFAKCVYLSHHGPEAIKNQFPENVVHKPDIKFIDGINIHFLDDSGVQVDAIIYCTGYKYGFPFLDDSCEIKVDQNYVAPLYKQLVSIPHSSMFFIGLPFRSFLFQLFELQVKCAINILTGKAILPERSEMENDTLQWEQTLASSGMPKNKYHCVAKYVKQYFTEIAELGNVPNYPDVFFDIFTLCNSTRLRELATYKKRVFKIIDCKAFSFL